MWLKIILAIGLWIGWVALAQAADEVPGCADDAPESCYETVARDALANGDPQTAITELKKGMARYPDSETLVLLLAKSYLTDENNFWALNTLAAYTTRHPDTCNAYMWMAWIQLGQGMIEASHEYLSAASCPESGPLAARHALLSGWVAGFRNESEAAGDAIRKAKAEPTAFPEDTQAIITLTPQLDPWYVEPLTWRLELSGGYASNALASSPDDRNSNGDSGFGQFDGSLRFIPNFNFWLHPYLEVETRMIGYTASEVKDISQVLLSGRPGLYWGGSRWSVLTAYRYESLLLSGGDAYGKGPVWYYTSHRGEVEAVPLNGLTVFFGAGKRKFRELGRNRTEVDGGIGGSGQVYHGLYLMGALAGRWHKATNEAYDRYGGSALINAFYLLPYNMSLKGGFVAAVDSYPHSNGYFAGSKQGEDRFDTTLKPYASFWSPPWYEMKIGLAYSYAHRMSTANAYDYGDHRIMLKLSWSGSSDPWSPDVYKPERHVEIDYRQAEKQSGSTERIQDLLRQDEAMQSGSSCVE